MTLQPASSTEARLAYNYPVVRRHTVTPWIIAAVFAAIMAGLAQYAAFWLAGGLIWAEFMPDEFLNMPMTNPWYYSLLYNGVHMLPNILIAAIAVGLLTVPLGKYLRGADLPAT